MAREALQVTLIGLVDYVLHVVRCLSPKLSSAAWMNTIRTHPGRSLWGEHQRTVPRIVKKQN